MATFESYVDKMRRCPYDPNHMVTSSRFAAHIVNCAKKPKSEKLSTCMYNHSHRVPPAQLAHHLLVCPDSKRLIREMAESSHLPPPKRNKPIDEEFAHTMGDNWDNPNGKSFVIKGLVEKEENHDDSNGGKESDDDEKKGVTVKTNIELQRMKPAERRKYYKELAESVKQKNEMKMESEVNDD